MPDPAPKPELMRSLGRLVRGLSVLFWSLPLALVFCVQTASTGWLQPAGGFSVVVPLTTTVLLWHGLGLMRDFSRDDRRWALVLDRASFLAIANIGLCPFLYWFHRAPYIPLYAIAVTLMGLTALLFLLQLNQVLLRLTALLPDETLRSETQVFTSLNASLLLLVPAYAALYLLLAQITAMPPVLLWVFQRMEALGPIPPLLLALVPMAITMSLLWKIKEAILNSVFGPH